MIITFNSLCPCGSGLKYKDCHLKKYIDELEKHPKQLPLISVEEAGFYINPRGAVVFYDKSKQPKLDIKTDVKKYVYSVGFENGNMPVITVGEKDGVICYLLPDEYIHWCESCVMTSLMNGTNIFPSYVIFSKVNGRYAADIL